MKIKLFLPIIFIIAADVLPIHSQDLYQQAGSSEKEKTVNAVIIYCTFKSPPDTAYTSYIDSLPYWYSQYGDYINSFIKTASSGALKINATVLTNGNRPFTGDDIFHSAGTVYSNLTPHFMTSVLDSVDKKYDLGKFDNDGPDGIPNSGDDDGYVDYVFLVCLWPLDRGGIGLNIPGDFISHDHSNKPGFGNIRISNNRNKATQQIIYNQISPVLIHEFGHSIGGFPDIDHTGGYYFNHYSIGSFDVMAHAHGFNEVPSIYNPYFRDEYLHWIKPVMITKDTTLELFDLLTSGIVYKYIPKLTKGAFPGEEFYVSYHTGKNRWERNWPVDKKYGGVLIWRAIRNGNISDNNISQSTCYPQLISIEAAHGKWKWQELPDSVHNTGIQDPLAGFDSLEIRKTKNGKEIEGPFYNKDAGSASVFFVPDKKKDFAFYTNPNSNLIYNDYKEKYAHNITDGFSIKNIRWVNGKVYADFSIDDYTVASDAALNAGKWYLNNTVTVKSGVTLTIEPGAELIFSKNSSMIVNGTLKAIGSSSNPVTFSGSGKDKWGKIVFNGKSSSGSVIDSATIQNETDIQFINGANVTIKNSAIDNLPKAFYIKNSKPHLTNNRN